MTNVWHILELESAERDLAFWSAQMRSINQQMLQIEQQCSMALRRRDDALRAVEQSQPTHKEGQ